MADGSRPGGRVLAPKAVLPFLFVLPPAVEALLSLVRGDVGGFGWAVAVAAGFFLAAWLIRKGVLAAGTTRRFPGRTLGAPLLGLSTAGAAWLLAGHGFLASILLGIGALIGVVLAYGSELKPERAELLSAEAAEAHAVVAEARGKLQRLKRARYQITGAPEMAQRIDRVADWIEKILTLIEEDPRDLRRSRKFLAVYLDGAGEVAEKFQALQAKGEAETLTPRFATLLDDMEQVSAEQHAKLLQNDTLDLDVQIEVLSERLKREGVA